MLVFGTVGFMFAAAYAQYRNGLFTSVAMLMMVLLSGLVAFGFWEPLADLLDLAGQQNLKFIAGSEDFLVLSVLFLVPLGILRLAYQFLAPEMIDEHGALQHIGAGAVGMVTGYLVAGFLVCAMQTLPLDERFLDYDPRGADAGLRNILPSDRVWMCIMRQAGAGSFRWKEEADGTPITFDREGTFELRYARYRRTTEARPAMPYLGEFDREIGRDKKGR